MNDNASIAAVAFCMALAAIAVASCEAVTVVSEQRAIQKAIEAGADPVAARCAIKGAYTACNIVEKRQAGAKP